VRNSIGDILKDCHVREKGRFLKDVTDAASMNGQVDSISLIEIGHSADPNDPRIGFHPAGDRLKCQTLARTGGPEKNGQSSPQIEGEIE